MFNKVILFLLIIVTLTLIVIAIKMPSGEDIRDLRPRRIRPGF